jgi:hypothetical protein
MKKFVINIEDESTWTDYQDGASRDVYYCATLYTEFGECLAMVKGLSKDRVRAELRHLIEAKFCHGKKYKLEVLE